MTLPEIFAEGSGAQRSLMVAGFARHFNAYYERGGDKSGVGICAERRASFNADGRSGNAA